VNAKQDLLVFAIVATFAVSIAACMSDVCGEGNPLRTRVFDYLQRGDLAQRQAANSSASQWYWCELGTPVVPSGRGELWPIANLNSGEAHGVGGWVRVYVDEAEIERSENGANDPWRSAAMTWFRMVANRAGIKNTDGAECFTVHEIADAHDRFMSCQSPATRSPVTADTTKDPLPTGTVPGGGDR